MLVTRLRSRSSTIRPVRRMEGGTDAPVPTMRRRTLAWITVPTALAALGSGIVVNAVTPRYTAEATVLLEGRGPWDGQAMARQIQATVSRDLAREAVRRLKLVGNPDFDPAAEGVGPGRQALMLLGIAANPLDRPSEDRVVDGFLDRLTVAPGAAARTVAVAFEATDARLAAGAANTVAQLSIAALGAEGSEVGSRSEGAVMLRRRVAEAEAKVEAYRARHGLSSGTAAPGPLLSTPQLTELSNQLAQARLARADIAGRVTAIRELLKDGRAYEIGDVATTDTLRRMIDSRIATRAQLALESRTLLPAHPRIKGLKAQLADLDSQIKTAAERAVLSLDNDAKGAEGRVVSLQAALDRKQSLAKGASDPAELIALEGDAKALRAELDASLDAATDTVSPGADGTEIRARVTAQAVEPSVPSFPDKLPIVGVTTLLAFLLSLGGAIVRSVRKGPKRDLPPAAAPAPTVETRTAAPLLASNPFALPEARPPGRWEETAAAPAPVRPAGPSLAVASRAATPAFDLDPLLARLSRRADPTVTSGRLIVVVDAGMTASGELHAALARTLRRSGSVVAVDLGGPSLQAGGPGFTDVVGGLAAFADVIQPGGPGGAHHVAPGRSGTGTLFDEPRALAFTLEAMAEAYGWVVCRLHGGPDMADLLALVATVSDSVVIASDADPADPVLGDLYGLAIDAGAGQVLIAQDRPARTRDTHPLPAFDLAA